MDARFRGLDAALQLVDVGVGQKERLEGALEDRRGESGGRLVGAEGVNEAPEIRRLDRLWQLCLDGRLERLDLGLDEDRPLLVQLLELAYALVERVDLGGGGVQIEDGEAVGENARDLFDVNLEEGLGRVSE